MDTQLLKSKLNKLWSGIITNFNFDLCAHTLSFDVTLERTGRRKHKVVFEGVSSFYFVSGLGERRFEMDKWDYAELSEIYYNASPTDKIAHTRTTAEYVTQDQSCANFIIEIWSSTLFVEAESIKIDHHHFWVGYPEHSQVAALAEK
jgi:hypothetical protein